MKYQGSMKEAGAEERKRDLKEKEREKVEMRRVSDVRLINYPVRRCIKQTSFLLFQVFLYFFLFSFDEKESLGLYQTREND